MDPNYFQLCQVEKSYPDRQPYSLNDPLNLAIIQLSKSCPFLNEMEIGVFVTKEQFTYTSLIFEDFFLFCVCLLIRVNCLLFFPYRSSRLKSFTFQANSSALETISSCSNLEILTLANLDVDSASFLHPVFKTLLEWFGNEIKIKLFLCTLRFLLAVANWNRWGWRMFTQKLTLFGSLGWWRTNSERGSLFPKICKISGIFNTRQFQLTIYLLSMF